MDINVDVTPKKLAPKAKAMADLAEQKETDRDGDVSAQQFSPNSSKEADALQTEASPQMDTLVEQKSTPTMNCPEAPDDDNLAEDGLTPESSPVTADEGKATADKTDILTKDFTEVETSTVEPVNASGNTVATVDAGVRIDDHALLEEAQRLLSERDISQ